jgi:hypothetical protein
MNIKLNKPLICKLSGSAQNRRLIGRFSSTHGIVHAGFRGYSNNISRIKVCVSKCATISCRQTLCISHTLTD